MKSTHDECEIGQAVETAIRPLAVALEEVRLNLDRLSNHPGLDDLDVAERLGISVRTVRAWRLEGKGPAYHHVGALVRYSLADLASWMAEQRVDGKRTIARGRRSNGKGNLRG